MCHVVIMQMSCQNKGPHDDKLQDSTIICSQLFSDYMMDMEGI